MTLDQLLMESIERYRALLILQEEVREALHKAPPVEIEALAEHLEALQRQAEKVDLALLPVLEKEWDSVTAGPLLRERMTLLGECAQQIQLLLGEAQAGRAVTLAELVQVREGRAAVAGYQGEERSRGDRVRSQV